jgi:hypothetical protein
MRIYLDVSLGIVEPLTRLHYFHPLKLRCIFPVQSRALFSSPTFAGIRIVVLIVALYRTHFIVSSLSFEGSRNSAYVWKMCTYNICPEEKATAPNVRGHCLNKQRHLGLMKPPGGDTFTISNI